MYNLFEHQIAYHSLALGFPSIDGCNAICLQTTAGLFGIHVYGCNQFDHIGKALEKESKAFAAFVAGHPMGRDFVHLYSVCFHQKRGWANGKTWKDEIKYYAKELKYSGPISAFDLSTVPNWPPGIGSATSDSAYVEYRRVFDKVTILYKPWHQCVTSGDVKPDTLSDGVNYLSVDHKGNVGTNWWFKKAVQSVGTNGAGFVISPESLRSSFTYKG